MFDLKIIYDNDFTNRIEKYILNNKIKFSTTCFYNNFVFQIYDEVKENNLDGYELYKYRQKLQKLNLDKICKILKCKIISIKYIILSTSGQYFIDYLNFKLYKDGYIFEKIDNKFKVYKSDIPESEYNYIKASKKYLIEEKNI